MTESKSSSLTTPKLDCQDGASGCIEINEQEAALNTCLAAMLDHKYERRPFTHSVRRLIDESSVKLGRANVLFLEGIRQYKFEGVPFKLFSEAEEKGCKHPVLYYFLGEWYSSYSTDRRLIQGINKALDYYSKSIGGGCARSHVGIAYVHEYRYNYIWIADDERKFARYLLDVEMDGCTDGSIMSRLGDNYASAHGCVRNQSLAKKYWARAAGFGYLTAHVSLHYSSGNAASMLALVEAAKRGEGRDAAWIIETMVERLQGIHQPAPRTFGPFKDKGSMMLYFCDALIEKQSPIGYHIKGSLHMYGNDGIPVNVAKAISIWEEADKLGLATWDVYRNLSRDVYFDRNSKKRNGKKVLEYCEKALVVAQRDHEVEQTIHYMAKVYAKGIRPIPRDGKKVLKCYQRGLDLLVDSHSRRSLYKKIVEVYTVGIPPVRINLDKAAHFNKKVLNEQSDEDEWD